jgi:hypothetical protein
MRSATHSALSMLRRSRASILLIAATVACSGDPASPPEASYTIAIHGGADQQGPAGSIAQQPLQVTVADVSNDPVQGVVVRFRAVSGGGGVTDSIGVTGLGGIALTFARLGGATGPQLYEASLLNAPSKSVTFELNATAAATLTRVDPATVKAGDTVRVVGQNFNVDPAGNIVYVGGLRAQVLSGEADTVLKIRVPACIPAGESSVRVEIGSASTNTLPVTYQASSQVVTLAVGEGLTVNSAELEGCLQLAAGGPRYLVVPQFATAADNPFATSFRIGRSMTMSAQVNAMPAAVAMRPAQTAQQRMDGEMRRLEEEIAPMAAIQGGEPQPGPLEALNLNSVRSFKVISDLGEPGEAPKFATSKARLRYIGDQILIYIDERSLGAVPQADIDRIGSLFDDRLYDLAVGQFGSESDLDGNGKVIVLMTPYVNALVTKAECTTSGFVAGFFYPNDLFLRNANSNKGEVFYTIVPDPDGTYSCPQPSNFVRRLIPGTFIHELQHMISFNQHVLARGGSSEDVWLNEGLSLIAEETAGRYYEERYPRPSTQPFPDSAAIFMEELMVHAFDYLSASRSYSVTTFESFGSLNERGAAWLFLRWLGDQKGQEIYSRLVQTRLTSVQNVQDKAGESLAALFGDFGLATAADIPGFARTSLAPRYRFVSRPGPDPIDYRTLFARISAKYNKPFPTPVRFTTFPTTGSEITGDMVQGTSAYFSLVTAAIPEPGISLAFKSDIGGPFPVLLGAQVGIVRVE